jgi:hypothetical protein
LILIYFLLELSLHALKNIGGLNPKMKATFLISLLGVMLAASPPGAVVRADGTGTTMAGSVDFIPAFSAASAVPEAASIILFGSVLGLSARIARRRKSRKR